MEKKYLYDAFISYRHAELDKFVAENLHRYMESFKPPKSILKSGKTSRTRIERVFRDKDELPLTSNLEDPIINAIIQSEYLIVICSPRLKESAWCKKEIETFIAYHGREKVLAVLVEGEPSESFPEELLYAEEVFYYPDGTQGITKRPLEPLAADVRGNSKKEVLKAMKTELLRLLAPMFAVTYDDLRQRHRERKLKKMVTASVAAAVLCLLIGAGSTIAALHIKKQKEQIEEQANEISAQAEEIKEQNQTLSENQAKSLAEKSLDLLDEGDRIGAIQTAGWALTEYDGITMPYTPEAKYALTESLHVYDSGNVVKAQYQLEASGIIDFMSVSPDGKTLVTFDRTTRLYVWDIATGDLIDSISDIELLFDERFFAFIDNDRFAYLNNKGLINVYQISEKQVTDTIAEDDVSGISSDSNGKYMAVSSGNEHTIYDMTTHKVLYTFDTKIKNGLDIKCYFTDDNIMLYTEAQSSATEADSNKDAVNEENGDTDVAAGADGNHDAAAKEKSEGDADDNSGSASEDESEKGTNSAKTILHFVNLTDGEIYASQVLDYEEVDNICFSKQRAYVIAHNVSNDLLDYGTGIIACNIKNGKSIWEHVMDDKFVTDIVLPDLEDAEEIMVYTFMEMFLLDKKTGKETDRFASGSGIAGSGTFKESDRFLVFSRNGELGMIYPENRNFLIHEYIFDCKSRNVETFTAAADGCFLVKPFNDNKITVYKMSANPEIAPYEGELLPEENVEDEELDSVAEAEKLGLENSALVKYIMYSPDKSTIFVSYSNSVLEIYNAADMTLLETISNQNDYINRYLGVDNEGNIYIAGEDVGYCLDGNYKLTAKIENLLMVDKENNQLIVGNTDNMYVLPIYTTEALIDMIPKN